DFQPLRRRSTRWSQDNLPSLRISDPIVPAQLDDRAADNWRPLFAIADAAGGTWPEQARKAALTLSGSASEADTSAAVQALADLRDLFRKRRADRIRSAEIVADLAEMLDRPWPEWARGKPLTQRQLARLLRPFGVQPRKIRLGEETAQGYLLEDLQDTFERYLSAHPE